MKIDGSRKNEIRDFVKTVKSLSQKKKIRFIEKGI